MGGFALVAPPRSGWCLVCGVQVSGLVVLIALARLLGYGAGHVPLAVRSGCGAAFAVQFAWGNGTATGAWVLLVGGKSQAFGCGSRVLVLLAVGRQFYSRWRRSWDVVLAVRAGGVVSGWGNACSVMHAGWLCCS